MVFLDSSQFYHGLTCISTTVPSSECSHASLLLKTTIINIISTLSHSCGPKNGESPFSWVAFGTGHPNHITHFSHFDITFVFFCILFFQHCVCKDKTTQCATMMLADNYKHRFTMPGMSWHTPLPLDLTMRDAMNERALILGDTETSKRWIVYYEFIIICSLLVTVVVVTQQHCDR